MIRCSQSRRPPSTNKLRYLLGLLLLAATSISVHFNAVASSSFANQQDYKNFVSNDNKDQEERLF